MRILQSLNLAQPCLLFLSQYALAFVHGRRKVFQLSSEEKLLAFRAIPLLHPLHDNTLHQWMIVLIDEFLNWAIYGVKRTKELTLSSLVELQTSKSHPDLFKEFESLNNTQRKRLRCFINFSQHNNQLTIEIQPSLSHKLYLLTVNTSSLSLIFLSRIAGNKASAFEFTCKGKEIVSSDNFETDGGVSQDNKILNKGGYFSKMLCVVDQNGVYEIYSFLVDPLYQFLTGETVVAGITEKPREIFLRNNILLVFLSTNILIINTKTSGVESYPQGGTPYISSEEIFLTSNRSLFRLTMTPSLKLEELVSGVEGSYLIVPQGQLFYSVSSSNSLDLLRRTQSEIQTTIVANSAERIIKAVHHKDMFSSVLQLHKVNRVTGQATRVEYYSNQPYLKEVVSCTHDINFKGCKVICPLESSFIVLTGPIRGTSFVEVQSTPNQICIINSPLNELFEQTQETFHFSTHQNLTIQATPTKLIIREGNNVPLKIPISSLFEGMDIPIDHCIRLSHYVVLVICNQLHLFQMRNPKNLNRKFIHCLDSEVEHISNLNSTQSVLVKLVDSNQLKLYSIDTTKDTLVLLSTVNLTKQILIHQTFTLPITINAMDYCLHLVDYSEHPLCFLVPNDSSPKHKDTAPVQHFELRYVRGRMIPVVSDSDKYAFTLGSIRIEVSKGHILEGKLLQPHIHCTKTINSTIRNVVYSKAIGKNLTLMVGEEEITLFEEATGRFASLRMETLTIEGYRCEVTFQESKMGAMMKIVGHEKCLKSESDFKGREIQRIKSVALIPGRLPSVIGELDLPFPAREIMMVMPGFFLVYDSQQIWLVRFLQQNQCLSISLLSTFHCDNEEFINMKNRLPPEDFEDQQFLLSFNKICQLREIRVIHLEDNYCELVVSYPSFLLILEIHNMVFKIQQIIRVDQPIESILDNFAPRKAYLKTRGKLVVLQKNTSAYELVEVEELDEDIVLATESLNWESKTRTIPLGSQTPLTQEESRLIVKSFGQLSISSRNKEHKEIYL